MRTNSSKGVDLILRDYLKVVRSRWKTIGVTLLLCTLGAAAITWLTTPLYQATTRLFVSVANSSSLAETYQGNRLSQERVVSYTDLVTGRTLAQRTIDKLQLKATPEDLTERLTATTKPGTVLIDINFLDESPVMARDIANTLSDEFVSMIRELETPEDGSPPDSRVVVEQRAAIPETPVVPNKPRNFLAGAAIGLLLGVGIAFLRELLDNTIKERRSLEELTGTGLVGTIPLDKERRKQAAIAFDKETTASSEAFRKLRTNLQFLSVDSPPRIIAVTSTVPSEGKSTTAINLALALAEDQHNVVLVDGDMRRPTIHKYLNLVGAVGFSSVLSGRVALADALQKTRSEQLTVLTAGGIPPNPSELLGSQMAKKMLHELRSQFDYVIVDSTPLLAVADAAILAAAVDGVLVITRYGHTKREQLSHAIRTLEDVDAKICGTVLTFMPMQGASSYHYHYHYDETNNATSRVATLRPRRVPSPNIARPGKSDAAPTDTEAKSAEQQQRTPLQD